jgi:hypothetical protein
MLVRTQFKSEALTLASPWAAHSARMEDVTAGASGAQG